MDRSCSARSVSSTSLACVIVVPYQAFLVAEVLAVAKSYGVVIDQATELIARLDVVSSLAHVAVNAPVEYVRPSMVPMATGNLELKAARHPCMEWHENVRRVACLSLLFSSSSCSSSFCCRCLLSRVCGSHPSRVECCFRLISSPTTTTSTGKKAASTSSLGQIWAVSPRTFVSWGSSVSWPKLEASFPLRCVRRCPDVPCVARANGALPFFF